MKKYLFCFSVLVVLVTQTVFAQNNIFKAGPSVMIHYDDWNESVSAVGGLEVSYEIGILKKLSLNIAATAHYGEHESPYEENQMAGNKQKDFLAGGQADIRFHFKERYRGPYIGIGADAKYIEAKYFFAPTENDPIPTLQDVERNLGLSLGTYIATSFGTLNPNLYLGGDPSGVNEYGVHAKLGINYVFTKRDKN